MSSAASQAVLVVFAIFCRVGGCLMLMPGFSSHRVATRIRLSLSVAVTLALAPLLYSVVEPLTFTGHPAIVLQVIAGECLVGVLFGFTGRLYFASIELAGTAIASMIGFGGLPGVPIEGNEPVPPLSALITLCATTVFFIGGLHILVLESLVETYQSVPPGNWFQTEASLTVVVDQLSKTLVLTGQLAAPFIIYAIVVNLAVGLTNKLSPQIPVFFVSLPFVLTGGLMLFLFAGSEMLVVFTSAFRAWLING